MNCTGPTQQGFGTRMERRGLIAYRWNTQLRGRRTPITN
jgi:hypothetical protein